MNLAMAIGAAAVEEEIGVCSIPLAVAAVVAFIAKSRYPHLEQPVVCRTVRLVTAGTVFHDWCVLPEERTSSFRVTAVAVLIDARLDELRRIRRAVRVVTARAGNLPFSNRHVGRALELRFALQMAL